MQDLNLVLNKTVTAVEKLFLNKTVTICYTASSGMIVTRTCSIKTCCANIKTLYKRMIATVRVRRTGRYHIMLRMQMNESANRPIRHSTNLYREKLGQYIAVYPGGAINLAN